MLNIPKRYIPKNITRAILVVITLSLAVNFIMNKQIVALISLIVISGFINYVNKNITMSLLISIIVTNLLLAMNYLETPNIEQLQMKKTAMLHDNAEMYI